MSKSITMTPVQSSQIAALGHDAASKTLAVEFKGWGGKPGSTYHYSNVDTETFNALASAESIGSHFGRFIKPNPTKYPFTKVKDPREQRDAK
jgi:hypothetical protein